MGFTPPPTLPDYSKLTQVLNSSGMQKVNPPVYEILSRLIQAVQQSQETLITSTIEQITNEVVNNFPFPTPSGVGLSSVTFTVSRLQMESLNSIPFVILAAIAGVIHVPVMCLMTTQQQRAFGANVTGTLRYDTIATDIAGPVTVVQGGLTPGVVVQFYENAVLQNWSMASTLNPTNKAIVLRGQVNTADGGAAGAPDINQITGILYYVEK